ncbi:MAG TPA: phage antirepressor N-terminal domain-containing protein [Ktedonosporobacter sp.]|nr:phage antirepressor N-terminal domain-containing protein [Ktedonosporobacter sp.]
MNDDIEISGDTSEPIQDQERALVPLQERTINFHGDELLVALVEMDGERQVYVPIRQFCEYLGLNWSAQYRRVERDEELRDTMVLVAITATQIHARGYYNRPVICLPLEMLPGFLFGVTPSRVKPEHQERVRLYRKKCYRALWEAFLRGELFTTEEAAGLVVPSTVATTVIPSGDSRIDALTEQIDFLTAIKSFFGRSPCSAH